MAKPEKAKRKVLGYEMDGTVLTVSDGDKVVRTFDFSEVPEELDGEFMRLGRTTKLVNFGAGEKETPAKLAAFDAGFARLVEGEWEKEREGGGPTVSAEVEALAELKGCGVAAIQKALREYDDETRKKILARPEVQKIADRIRKDRVVAADLSDMAK